MRVLQYQTSLIAALIALAMPVQSPAFDSGSSGADGPFNPAADIQLTLPPSGIFNFTEVNIPAGVTVTFAKNALNTPVRMLVSGNVTIDGTISVDGGAGEAFNNSGTPGTGGPGGFDGGQGGLFSSTGSYQGGNGQGPGGGEGGCTTASAYAGGGSYGSKGQGNTCAPSGPTYGNAELLPLIGGSGGGGGFGLANIGPGGGGGAGAILIAASGTVTINGSITANGGVAGLDNWSTGSGWAGSGSGGAIRIIATTLQGEGTITALGNTAGTDSGYGRIRLEAEDMLRTSGTTPAFIFSTPNPVLIANLPTLRISNVGGIAAPAAPTGYRDIELPGTTTNPVTVQFETTNIPLGTILILTASPVRGDSVTVNSGGVAGTEASGTDSATIDLPNGNSILSAQTTFLVTAALGDTFSRFARGERVEQVKVAYVPGSGAETTFITVTGKEYTWPSNTVALN